MIFGVGTDIVAVARITQASENARFVQKILHPLEYAVWQERQAQNPQRAVVYAATRFAAKEALSKAMGTGFRAPMAWHACAVVSDESGQPQWRFFDAMREWMDARQLQAHVSLSDEADYAQAFCILEQVK